MSLQRRERSLQQAELGVCIFVLAATPYIIDQGVIISRFTDLCLYTLVASTNTFTRVLIWLFLSRSVNARTNENHLSLLNKSIFTAVSHARGVIFLNLVDRRRA